MVAGGRLRRLNSRRLPPARRFRHVGRNIGVRVALAPLRPGGLACRVNRIPHRWLLGTARLGILRRIRELESATRRAFSLGPPKPRLVPRPPRRRAGSRGLRLTHVVVSSDLNERYLDLWPLASRAWQEIAGVEPLLVLVADEVAVPSALRSDPNVRVFPPVAGVHTAFQAQCIRLLYPALLDGAGGVVVADIDMVPLNRSYFHRPAGHVAETDFVAYRDLMLSDREVPICYNAAAPRTWLELFGVAAMGEAAERLTEWAENLAYDGVPGGSGWATDQRTLYRALIDFGARSRRVWILDDRYTGFRRLDRRSIGAGELTASDEHAIALGEFSDFHCALPHVEFRELNERVVDLAITATR